MIRTALILALSAAGAAASAQDDVAIGWAMKPALEGLDLDGDGLFDQSELGGTRVPEAFDLDGDGLFSLVELSQGYFALSDADDDGYLDAGELEAMSGLPAAGVYVMGL